MQFCQQCAEKLPLFKWANLFYYTMVNSFSRYLPNLRCQFDILRPQQLTLSPIQLSVHCTVLYYSDTQGSYLYNCHHSAFVIFTVKLHTTLPQCQNTTMTTAVKLQNTPSTVTRLSLLYSCLGHDTQVCWKLRHQKIAEMPISLHV